MYVCVFKLGKNDRRRDSRVSLLETADTRTIIFPGLTFICSRSSTTDSIHNELRYRREHVCYGMIAQIVDSREVDEEKKILENADTSREYCHSVE